MSLVIDSEGLTLPLGIRNVGIVDDAGGTHFERQMTRAYLVDFYQSGLLTLTGNIRPKHNRANVTGRTKTMIQKWTRGLLDNKEIIDSISVRLNPDAREYEVWNDEETGDICLTIRQGLLDCAVDSLSRIKSILAAAENPLASFSLETRFQVRIWLLNNIDAKKVATIYNTRGDKELRTRGYTAEADDIARAHRIK